MGFSKMMELLQIKNKGKIVLCNAGNFYIAIGKDAVLLKEILGMKVSCFKPEVCKVGFPIASLEKYMGLIEEKQYGYIVYYLDKEKSNLEVIAKYNGKNKNNIPRNNSSCLNCGKGTKRYKKEDKYIEAVAKLYEEEIKEQEENAKIKEKQNEKNMVPKQKQEKEQKLILIPKSEKYIEYMLQVIFKLPRTEKFSIGTEYKRAMYEMLENILTISKVNDKNIMNYLNKIDAGLSLQRLYLRIMKKNKWIDEKKFQVAMEQIYEIGKILGGLIKYYAKNITK